MTSPLTAWRLAARLAPCIALAIPTWVYAGQMDKIRETHAIVIAHRDASIPFSYLDDQKRPIGYSMDLCAKIVSALERELKIPSITVRYLQVSSATRIPSVAQGQATMECGSTANTEERRKLVDFSIAHFISASRLLVRTDAGINDLDDLEGKTVVSTKDSTNMLALQRLSNDRGLRLKVVEANDHAEGFAMVQNKKALAFAMDDVLLYGLRANSGQPQSYKIIGKSMDIVPYAIMLPKGDPPFKRLVDTEMRRIIATGEIKTLYHKWFEEAIAPKGINLSLPMPPLLRDSFKYPSDKVGDLKE